MSNYPGPGPGVQAPHGPPANYQQQQPQQPFTSQWTGTNCSVCGRPQFTSPGGITCENGHTGAPAAAGPTPVAGPPAGPTAGPPSGPVTFPGMIDPWANSDPAIRAALDQERENLKNTGYDKTDFLKFKQPTAQGETAETMVRVLPAWPGKVQPGFWWRSVGHFIDASFEGKKVRIPIACPVAMGPVLFPNQPPIPCPVCERKDRAAQAGDQQLVKTLDSKPRYLANVIDVSEPKRHWKQDVKTGIWTLSAAVASFGKSVFNKISNICYQRGGDISHLQTGRIIKVLAVKVGKEARDVRYDAIDASEPGPLPAGWEAIVLHDLSAVEPIREYSEVARWIAESYPERSMVQVPAGPTPVWNGREWVAPQAGGYPVTQGYPPSPAGPGYQGPGPAPQQNYAPPAQQQPPPGAWGPPAGQPAPQQNYAPPAQQQPPPGAWGPPAGQPAPQQNYAPPAQQQPPPGAWGPPAGQPAPQQNYAPPAQQQPPPGAWGPPAGQPAPQQNYAPPAQQQPPPGAWGPPAGQPAPQQNYAPPAQQQPPPGAWGPPAGQPAPQQNYAPPAVGIPGQGYAQPAQGGPGQPPPGQPLANPSDDIPF